MITLFRSDDYRDSNAIEEMLGNVSPVYEIVQMSSDQQRPSGFPEGSRPPVLMDDGASFEGDEEIRRYLERLRELKSGRDKTEYDSSYLDDASWI